ncbi:MAG: patatin-like phospholipase family protein [Clostridiales bacterium]|jgi:NTE family protein|nr:patatin-like phospholipase family protein [Clostridiales bacterium]
MKLKCNAVFSGGGVKGVGFAGAVTAFENAGYSFQSVAGVSVGAIVASLIAAGYSADELNKEVQKIEYTKFLRKGFFSGFGKIGKLINSSIFYGLYKSDYFEHWLTKLLDAKGKRTFGDIKIPYPTDNVKYKFQAIAMDITDENMLILPDDISKFGVDPDSFPIAKAVRMSMSLPLYFEPYTLKLNSHTHVIVDGGLLSSYPIWLFDSCQAPSIPTFGFKVSDFTSPEAKHLEGQPKPGNFIKYSEAIISTLARAHDKRYISESPGDAQRSIVIPTTVKTSSGVKKITTTYFKITSEESLALYNNGKKAAETFLSQWNFDNWKNAYYPNRL